MRRTPRSRRSCPSTRATRPLENRDSRRDTRRSCTWFRPTSAARRDRARGPKKRSSPEFGDVLVLRRTTAPRDSSHMLRARRFWDSRALDAWHRSATGSIRFHDTRRTSRCRFRDRLCRSRASGRPRARCHPRSPPRDTCCTSPRSDLPAARRGNRCTKVRTRPSTSAADFFRRDRDTRQRMLCSRDPSSLPAQRGSHRNEFRPRRRRAFRRSDCPAMVTRDTSSNRIQRNAIPSLARARRAGLRVDPRKKSTDRAADTRGLSCRDTFRTRARRRADHDSSYMRVHSAPGSSRRSVARACRRGNARTRSDRSRRASVATSRIAASCREMQAIADRRCSARARRSRTPVRRMRPMMRFARACHRRRGRREVPKKARRAPARRRSREALPARPKAARTRSRRCIHRHASLPPARSRNDIRRIFPARRA